MRCNDILRVQILQVVRMEVDDEQRDVISAALVNSFLADALRYFS